MKKLKCVQKHVKLKCFACSLVAFAAKLLECKSYLINSRGVRATHSYILYNLLFKSCRVAPLYLRKIQTQRSTCQFIYTKRSATIETNKQTNDTAHNIILSSWHHYSLTVSFVTCNVQGLDLSTTAKQVSNFSQEHTCAIVYIKQVIVIIILSPFAQNLGKEYQTQSAPHHWIPSFIDSSELSIHNCYKFSTS